jgi:hypothetical protein
MLYLGRDKGCSLGLMVMEKDVTVDLLLGRRLIVARGDPEHRDEIL